MSEQKKTFALTLDMVRTISQHPFEVVAGDTGNVLNVTLTNDGAAVDLAGCYVCAVFRSNGFTAMQDDTNGLTLGEAAGTFTLALLPSCYGPGEVSADIQVYSGADRATLITGKRFTFRCINALLNEETMAAQATYPPLITATNAANTAAAAANAAAANNGDMVKSVYDTDGDGTVDDAEKLGGKLPGYFATAAALNAHAARHKTGGADALTPANIGAATAAAFNAHAARHAAGGADALTPANIGAALPAASLTATLPATAESYTASGDGFTISVAVTGIVLTGFDYIVAPAPASHAAYAAAGARMLDPDTAGYAPFYVDSVPESALTVNILKVQVA